MDFSHLITAALGLQDVTIEKFEFDRSKLSLRVFVRQDRASCLCHQCGNQIGYVHEWKERSLRAPPFGAFLYVEVILFQLRGYCLGCDDKIRSAHISFLYPDFDTLTYSFCEFAGRLMEEMPCEALARFLNASSKTLWSLDQNRMAKLKPLMKFPENIDLEKMSGDEVHFRTMPKENSLDRPEIKYVTNLVCYDQSKVLANAPGRSQRSLLTCLNQLSPEQLARIRYFSLDMHEPFIKAVRKMCPNARICIDRFHLAEYANNIFDDVRKCEFRKAKESKDGFQVDMLAPHRRFVLVECEKMLSKKDLRMLDKLKEINKNILNGMILVEHFHSILDKIDTTGWFWGPDNRLAQNTPF